VVKAKVEEAVSTELKVMRVVYAVVDDRPGGEFMSLWSTPELAEREAARQKEKAEATSENPLAGSSIIVQPVEMDIEREDTIWGD
jgi:hypothetical protein